MDTATALVIVAVIVVLVIFALIALAASLLSGMISQEQEPFERALARDKDADPCNETATEQGS